MKNDIVETGIFIIMGFTIAQYGIWAGAISLTATSIWIIFQLIRSLIRWKDERIKLRQERKKAEEERLKIQKENQLLDLAIKEKQQRLNKK